MGELEMFGGTKNTMSSREIATITSKEHSKVLRTIRDLMGKGLVSQIGSLKFEYRNQFFDYYELNKRDSLVLVARLSPEFTAAIVDRWQVLEVNNQMALPQNFAEALQLAADQQKKIIEANNTIKLNEPKVAFANAVSSSEGSILIRDYAKEISNGGFKIGQNRLFEWFRSNGYIMKDNSPYQQYIEQGLFEVVTRMVGSGDAMFTTKTTKISGKGRVYFNDKIKQDAKS